MAQQVVVIPGQGVVSDPDGQTNIPAMAASGTPIAGSELSLGNLFGTDFQSYKDFIMEQTDKNNAWSAKQAQSQNAFQERMNQIAMEFNASEAAKNRDWQEMMSNTAHQREIRDLQAAGLNPVLSASGGNGAAVTSGATASGVTSSGAKGETDTSANGAIAAVYGSLISAQTQMANAQLSAKTNLEIADKQMRASMYAAQMAAETARQSNPYQIISEIVKGSQGGSGSTWSNLANNLIDGLFGSSGSSAKGVQPLSKDWFKEIADNTKAHYKEWNDASLWNRKKRP